MEILLYGSDKEIEERMRGVVTASGGAGAVCFHASLESLLKVLQQPSAEPRITVIAVSGSRELEALSRHRTTIGDMRTILILPDRTKATVHQALRLYPRFIAYRDGDFQDLAAILRKMNKKIPKSASHRHGTI
ncbi:MAG: hypothetical protein ACOZF0_10270 [Thermodesulfobacteriota bacterium]